MTRLPDEFMTTPWSLLDELQREQAPADRERVLHRIIELYQPAIQAYVGRIVRDPHLAADIAQSFLVDVVYKRNVLDRADSGRGRLRALLKTAIGHYARDVLRREKKYRTSELPSGLTDPLAEAERAFDRAIVATMLEEALRRCEDHFSAPSRHHKWLAFTQKVLLPLTAGAVPPTNEKLMLELGFKTAESVSSGIRDVKCRLRSELNAVVRETVTSSADCELETEDLLQAWLSSN